ncbi:MAG TPA: type 4a pilus biogenesis protein PilO [Candidatus Acidoferrales bacterium]|nr:type 4a pilus biogenesis protein PilO [Candidatus Acidoferrales bacterium]
MTSRNNSRKWKLAVKIALACLLVLDGALIFANVRIANEAPQSQALERNHLAEKDKLLAADVAEGKAIEKHLPDVGKECDAFYRTNLLPASTGYSTVISDLGQMGKDAGVQIGGVGFHETAVKDRGLSEVQMSAAVQGNYQSLIRLINSLEHSPHFYVLDGLTLASEASGNIKLNVTLRTYFRI